MTSQPKTRTLHGHEAIRYAEAYGLRLHKYADPTEDARESLSLEEAREIAAEDPGLIWLEAPTEIATVTVPEDVTACGSTLYAGTYQVEMPADYDPELVTGEDILCDGALRIVDEREEEPEPTRFHAGDRVQSDEGGPDTGTVIDTDPEDSDDPGAGPGTVLVAWDSGTRTWTPAELLEDEDAEPEAAASQARARWTRWSSRWVVAVDRGCRAGETVEVEAAPGKAAQTVQLVSEFAPCMWTVKEEGR